MNLTEQLVSYVLSAMMSWIPLGNQYERGHDGKWLRDAHGYYVKEAGEEAYARYKATAEAIVDVALSDSNAPLFLGLHGESESLIGRVKTALQIASIGSFEGGFHKWVENGDCNTPIWKLHHEQECDGGSAFTNWQIHVYGYVIFHGELQQSQYLPQEYMKEHQDDIITGKKLVGDQRLAVQVAYYLVRYSTHKFHTLCAYTGEPCTGSHPKANKRMARAIEYMRKNPFMYVEPGPPPADLLQPLSDMLRGSVALEVPAFRGQLLLN